MSWMPWVWEKPLGICINAPLHRAGTGKKKLAGWLMDKDGCLKAVYVTQSQDHTAAITGPVERTWCLAASFAGGLRPCGAARLTGVLHYFTRGPDGIF